MPRELIRVTLDMAGNHVIVEYGERRAAGLTYEQANERTRLIEGLKEFSEFASAEKIEDEDRQGLVEKKKRLEALNEMEEVPHIEWYPLEAHLIDSLLIVVSPRNLHTYVENIPAYLLDRILDPKGNVTINVGSETKTEGAFVTPEDEKTDKLMKDLQEDEDHSVVLDQHGKRVQPDVGLLQSHTEAELAVIKIIAPDTPNWADLVTVKEMPERRLVFIRPNKFLGEVWKTINRALRELYGECWISEGRGDRDAHWEVPT